MLKAIHDERVRFDRRLQIETIALPPATAGRHYEVRLRAAGGALPYEWKLVQGPLPEGLELEESGLLAGVPLLPGNVLLVVAVRDSTLDWKSYVIRHFVLEVAPEGSS